MVKKVQTEQVWCMGFHYRSLYTLSHITIPMQVGVAQQVRLAATYVGMVMYV